MPENAQTPQRRVHAVLDGGGGDAGRASQKVDSKSICGAGTRTDPGMTSFFRMDTMNNPPIAPQLLCRWAKNDELCNEALDAPPYRQHPSADCPLHIDSCQPPMS